MRPQRPIGEEATDSLKELLKKTKTKADFQRVQCMWLRAAFSMPSDQVARAVGLSSATVKKLWSQYFLGGEEALIARGRGGRRRANLSLEEEKKARGLKGLRLPGTPLPPTEENRRLARISGL